MFKINKIYFFNELSSTNDYLISNYKNYDNLTIISSAIQSKGRGRLNRTWVSNYKENLYFSVLLKEISLFKILTHIPILCSLSIFRTICTYHRLNIKIKWPNDIVFVNNNIFFKISGILIDSFKDYMVLGFGINLNKAPSIEGQNTSSIKDLINTTVDKNIFLNNFISNFENIFNYYLKHDFNSFINEYNNNAYKINEYIEIKDKLNIYKGNYLGIDNNGFAILNNNNNLTRVLNGEVKNNL